MDVHVPAVVTAALRRKGNDVLTRQEDGTRRQSAPELLERASALHRVLVKQDEGFLSLAAQWQSAGRAFSGVVYAPQIGTSIGRFIEDLELLARCATTSELENLVTHLPLK
jgi:hypothetical protein